MGHRTGRPHEHRNARRVKLMVDITAQILAEDADLTLCEALRLLAATRAAAMRLCPDHAQTFDSETVPHLERIVFERFRITPAPPVN